MTFFIDVSIPFHSNSLPACFLPFTLLIGLTYLNTTLYIQCPFRWFLLSNSIKYRTMKNKMKRSSISRILLAGLFCGVATALIANIYFFIYKGSTGIEPGWLINPVIILVSVPAIVVIASIIYYFIVYYFEKKESLFIYLTVALVLISAGLILSLPYSGEKSVVTLNDGLLLGIIVITGISTCVFFPYLVHHPKIYMTYNQMYWHRNYRSE